MYTQYWRVVKLDTELNSIARLYRFLSDRVGVNEQKIEGINSKVTQGSSTEMDTLRRLHMMLRNQSGLQANTNMELSNKSQSLEERRLIHERELIGIKERQHSNTQDINNMAASLDHTIRQRVGDAVSFALGRKVSGCILCPLV
eukprot:GHVR01157479.1.p1 GENE.GHVR01157479.1~~GHVR01157479.1.p1  ORF type:complete len:144 (+),score=25.37 GHVR01157479.1:401-832(+)